MANLPTADEQLLLELVNRFRQNPSADAARFIGAAAPTDVRQAMAYFGVSADALVGQLAGLGTTAPLAWNEALSVASEGHNAAMIAANEQSHQTAGELALGPRVLGAGYGYRAVGENVYAYAANPFYAHAGFVVDWGYDAGESPTGHFAATGDGMQDPAGHRVALASGSYTEIGIAVTAADGGPDGVGPLVITQDLGTRFNYQPQFVGVVINDTDHDDFYDVGEGVGDVAITLRSGTGATYATSSWASGGWQIAVPQGDYTITFSSGAFAGSVTKTAVLGGSNVKVDVEAAQATAAVADARHDFNGDGRSDILWRGADGAFSDWLGQPDGGFVGNDAAAFRRVDASWTVAGIGDFNGDGRDDVLWRGAGGALSDWLATDSGGFVANDANALTQVGTDWRVAGTGDFNGDGRDDLVWRHADGALSSWLGTASGGFAPNDGAALRQVPTSWQIAGTGDFNGDGRDDLVWRNTDGTLSNWLGVASGDWTANDGAASMSVATSWQIAGTGDYNGDGRDDILWRNADGGVSDWLGTASGGWIANDANAYRTAPTDWSIVDTGDYNGDGRDDILWRSAGGALSDWLADAAGGHTPNDANAFQLIPNSWTVQGDFLLY